MTRNLKALGLALVAMFAMSAVVASAASAEGPQGFLATENNQAVTLDGTEIPETTNALTAFGLPVKCPGTTYTGHKFISKHETETNPKLEHGLIPSGATTVTITPDYEQENCQAELSGGLPATVDPNGCDFVVHIGGTTTDTEGKPIPNTYKAIYDIVCPAGKEITVTVWFSEAEHLENKEACTIHIPEQSDLHGGHVTDETNGHLRLDGQVTGIDATKTKDNLHPLLCAHATTTDGRFDVNVTVTGTNAEKESIEVGISE